MSEAPALPERIWHEPVRGGYPHPGILSLSGKGRLEHVRGGGAFPTPPLFHLTGARPTGFGNGTADAEMPASGWLLNSAGLIGGGMLAIVADIAFGISVQTELPAATPYTTAELSLSFLRPASAGTTIAAHGQAIHVGRTVGLSEAFLLDGERLLAHGTSRLSILPAIDGLPELPADLPPYEAPDGVDPYLRPPPETVLPAETWSELGGLEIVERQIAGELPPPPVHFLTGIRPTAVSEGRASMEMPASEWLNSPAGRLQGGTITMLADAAMAIAALSTAPAGTAIAGLDLKINFLRPGLADGRPLFATAEVEHSGRTLAVTRARIANAEGKPVALATGSSMYLPPRALDPA